MADLNYTRAELERAMNKLVWANWTPTVSSSGGSGATFDVEVAEYFRLGDTIYFNLVILVTAIGAASGVMTVTMPFTPDETIATYSPILGTGRGAGLQHKIYWSDASGVAVVTYFSNLTFAWVAPRRHYISGSYKI